MIAEIKSKIPLYWSKFTLWTRNTWGQLKVRQWSQKEFFVLFVFAFAIGIASKSIASHTFTIGHDDYLIHVEKGVETITSPTITKGLICEE